MSPNLKRPREDDDEDDYSPNNKKKSNKTYTSTLPLLKCATSSPPFQQPYQLLSFSYTSMPGNHDDSNTSRVRKLEWNNHSMKYYIPPPQGANLAYGYQRWIRRPEERARLDALLQACTRVDLDCKSEFRKGIQAERRRADIMTWRGIGTKLLTAPYEQRDSWTLNVMQVNGTIYLEEHATEETLSRKMNVSERQNLNTYYGYAFEAYCTANSPPSSQNTYPTTQRSSKGWGDEVVDTNIQWCSVVKTKLGSYRLLLGGEVDCVRDRYTGQPDTFVELKTSLVIRPSNINDEVNFEKKLLKFYFQSFLLGVPEVVVGFRSPSGYLQTVQSFKTLDLPRLVRGKPHSWNPSLCLTWGENVISFLRSEIRAYREKNRLELPNIPNSDTNNAETIVWRLVFTPGVGLSLRVLDQEEVKEVGNDEDRVGFLPRWYWNHINEDSQELPEALATTNNQATACG